MDFVERLKNIQDHLELSDAEMARRMGCKNRQLYQMTRTGKAPLGLTILKGGVRAFPELLGDAVFFLIGDVAITKTIGGDTINHNDSERPSDAVFSRFKTLWSGLVLRAKKLWHNSKEL